MVRASLAVVAAIIALALFVTSCAPQQPSLPPANETNSTSSVSGIQDLVLTTHDLQELGMILNGNCSVEDYQTSAYSTLAQYSMCDYTIPSLNNTDLIIELKKFSDRNALNGSYQYDSSHLYGAGGLLSENTYGDQSRFRVNDISDYGGQFDTPGVYFYHLWIVKDDYLIHITSKGTENAQTDIAKIGQQFMAKFS